MTCASNEKLRPMEDHDRRWKVRAFFEPRDAWVGVFWDRPVSYGDQGQPLIQHLKVYVCLLPFLPVVFHRTERVSAMHGKVGS